MQAWEARQVLPDAVRAQEQRGESPHEAIAGGQMRRAMSGAMADEQLLLEQQGLCGDGMSPAWAKKLGEGDQQVNIEDETLAHG